ncbi:hypothetical protein [Streptomyces arenae]|uniref:hypothetical protein n=1 Tax=Streptomyces arenae TaxID=29301 RepID=UPI0026593F1E|nr:hypothetical protein [Streptomyces arenae]MCG7206962.1 hypothetical protein [Streptomyces arenae]
MGDIVRVSCPDTPARVTDKSPHHVSIEWPWWAVDPDSDWIHWNGQVALPHDPSSYEGQTGLFRTTPPLDTLEPGTTCRVGIPPTLVHVIAVDRFDPPLETGRLPRPRRHVVLLRAGHSHDPEREEQGEEFDPDDDIPITFDLVFRPYACLTPGDEVADAAGRAWRFDTPWDWRPFDGAEPHEPHWPLTLLTRGSHPADPEMAVTVTAATKVGSHHEELARWSELAQATAPPP